jgi:hypothetical protein
MQSVRSLPAYPAHALCASSSAVAAPVVVLGAAAGAGAVALGVSAALFCVPAAVAVPAIAHIASAATSALSFHVLMLPPLRWIDVNPRKGNGSSIRAIAIRPARGRDIDPGPRK